MSWHWSLLVYAVIGLFFVEGCTRTELKLYARDIPVLGQMLIFVIWPVLLVRAVWRTRGGTK